MSAPLYSSFPVATATGVPLTPTIQGPAGDDGAAGINAFTLTSGNFTQPAIGSSVTVSVVSSAWIAVGQSIYVAGGGYYTVSSVPNSTSVVLTNSGYVGSAVAGVVIASGASVVPGGVIGASTGGIGYGTAAELAASGMAGPGIWILTDSVPPYQLEIIPP